MSKLYGDDILRLAQLSRLRLSPAEVTQFANEITAILKYVEQLQSANLDGLAPTYQVSGLQDVTRADEIVSYQADPKALMKLAPAVLENQFRVKRMVN